MTVDPIKLALVGSWAATGLGVGLWLWSWLGEKNPIQKLRFRDCGLVMVFGAILVRIVTQDRAMTPLDWAMVLIGPLFIAAALWRLAQTSNTVPKP